MPRVEAMLAPRPSADRCSHSTEVGSCGGLEAEALWVAFEDIHPRTKGTIMRPPTRSDDAFSWNAGLLAPRQLDRPRTSFASNELFLALLRAFRPHGGLLRHEEVERRAARSARFEAPLHFAWESESWWPWFQFDRSGAAVNGVVLSVAEELALDYDKLQLCIWFASPNTWLGGLRPVEVLHDGATRVTAAARTDRYIARG